MIPWGQERKILGGLVGGEVIEAVGAVSLRNENMCRVWGGRESHIQIFESDIEKN